MDAKARPPTEAQSRPRRRGRGGRAARHETEAKATIAQAPVILRRTPLWDVMSSEACEIAERNADLLLQENGIVMNDPDCQALWKEAGADLSGELIRIPKGLARDLCQSAPSQFIQHARNPERSVPLGGDHMVLAPVYGPPFVHDEEKGRRYGQIADFENLAKLTYMLPYFHHAGGTLCEPVDLPVNKRHLDMVRSHIVLSDKAFMGSVTSQQRAEDSIEMARIVFGTDFVDQNACLLSLININSPLVLDATMAGAMKVYARANQATIVSPFIMAGATGPVGPLGVVTQALAEGMAAVATVQLLRKGAPVIFGTFISTLAMKTGAPAFGGPESALMTLAMAKLARRLKVPYRAGGAYTSAKTLDAQAAAESQNSAIMTFGAGVNFVLHAGGWLDGGLCSSYEKLVFDHDQLGKMTRLAEGLSADTNSQAMDAFEEVPPGHHFLGSEHTKRNYASIFYTPTFGDTSPYDQWRLEGETRATAKATKVWKSLLASYEPPPLDEGIREHLDAFIAQRKAAEPDALV